MRDNGNGVSLFGIAKAVEWFGDELGFMGWGFECSHHSFKGALRIGGFRRRTFNVYDYEDLASPKYYDT
jgi:hypothetical protein